MTGHHKEKYHVVTSRVVPTCVGPAHGSTTWDKQVLYAFCWPKMDSTQGSCCYDLEFPIPRESAHQTDAQRWFVRKHKEMGHDNFMAHFDDWALGCEAWLYTQHGKVEYLPGANLRFGRHRDVMLAPLSLVAPFPSRKDEYDDWNKPGFYHATACHGSQTLSGQLSGGLTCVLRD